MNEGLKEQLMELVDIYSQSDKFKNLTKEEILFQLEKALVSGNHLAVYLIEKIEYMPDDIKSLEEASEKLCEMDYEIWCAWKNLMEISKFLEK